MSLRYCFWSVCTDDYAPMMEQCVRTARAAGVFREFHVLTDRPVAGCECYDAFQCDKADGLFKLNYLKLGMSRLNFDFFIWLDADSVFVRNPVDILGCLSRSPMHVPLELNLSAAKDRDWNGTDCEELDAFFRSEGVANQVYLSQSAFWLLHHDAIEEVYELASRFWHRACQSRLHLDVDAALGFAMQMLCADPSAHLLLARPDVWASDDLGHFGNSLPDEHPWPWGHPLAEEPVMIRPAIVHVPKARRLLAGDLGCQVPRTQSYG